MRLFTFGCSLTQFFYPTWADILIKHFGQGQNWGRLGAGNQYIFTRLWEADSIYKFNKDDIVIIQFTGMYRDDRFIEGHGWHLAGGIYRGQLKDEQMDLNAFEYKSQYQWADALHMTMRDCAMISSIKTMLKERGCKTIYFAFDDFIKDDKILDHTTPLSYEDTSAVINEYKDYLKMDKPAIMPWIGWNEGSTDFIRSRPLVTDFSKQIRPELHPLPFEHTYYLEENILPELGISSLNEQAIELAEYYEEKMICKEPTDLQTLGWIQQNQDKIGWSDD